MFTFNAKTSEAVQKAIMGAYNRGDELIAQFKKPGQAARWIAFMNGDRYAK